MEMLETKNGNALVVTFKGRLDSVTSPPTQDRLLALVERGDTRLVLDLADLDYVSSAGLRVFMLVAKKIKSLNGRVVLCSLREPIREIFDIAGFSSLFPIAATQAEALQQAN